MLRATERSKVLPRAPRRRERSCESVVSRCGQSTAPGGRAPSVAQSHEIQLGARALRAPLQVAFVEALRAILLDASQRRLPARRLGGIDIPLRQRGDQLKQHNNRADLAPRAIIS